MATIDSTLDTSVDTLNSTASLNTSSDVFSASDPTSKIRRISVSSSGIQGNDASLSPSTSGDGRYTAFQSKASNLVAKDTNGFQDIFVYDAKKRTTKRISVSSNGQQANGASFDPCISSNGRFVAFESEASNLVSGDTNKVPDIFVYDLQKSKISRVSVDSNGVQGNDYSTKPFISDDGRYVTFTSNANNLASNDLNGLDGKFPSVFLHDEITGTTTLVSSVIESANKNSASFSYGISGDGNYLLYSNTDLNILPQRLTGYAVNQSLYLYDRQAGTSKKLEGISGFGFNATVSNDGHYVDYVYYRYPDQTSSVMQYDSVANTTSIINIGSYSVFGLSLSKDARYLIASSGTGLTPNYITITVQDRQTGENRSVLVNPNGNVSSLGISSDGSIIGFASDASNLVSNDTNNSSDIFQAKNPFFS